MTSSNKLTAGDIVKKVLLYAALILMAFVMLVPFAWMISASLKFEKDVFSFPIVWFPENPQWGNYSERRRKCDNCCHKARDEWTSGRKSGTVLYGSGCHTKLHLYDRFHFNH